MYIYYHYHNNRPSATAPRAKIPDSLISHCGEDNVSFNSGSKMGRRSCLKTFDRQSKAAALHLPKQHT